MIDRSARPQPPNTPTEPPAAPGNLWRGEYPASPKAIGEIRRAAQQFAEEHGAPDRTCTDIALAVSEAATNAVVHAFAGREPGTLTVTARALRDAIEISVVDDGNGMAPRPDSPGLGLGLPTIAQLTERFDVQPGPNGRGTDFSLRFAAPGVAGTAGDLSVEHAALLVDIARAADAGGWPVVGVDRLAELLVGALADVAVVDVIADDPQRPQRLTARVAAADPDPHERWLLGRAEDDVSEDSPALLAIREGRPRVYDLEDVGSARDRAGIKALDLRWWIALPLRREDQVLGSLGLGLSSRHSRPDDALMALCEQIADRAAGALANHQVIAELQRTRGRLERILGVLGEAVTVHGDDNRVVYANEAAARLLGAASVDEVLAAAPGELAARFSVTREDGSPVALEEFPGSRLLAGEDAPSLVTRSVHLATGREYWLKTTATRLDEEGPLAVNIIQDVTDAKVAEQRQRFLAEAGELLFSSLGLDETLERIARMTVGALSDWCAVDLLDGARLKRVALAHVDPRKEAFGREFHERYPPDLQADEGFAAVLRDGQPLLYEQITDEMITAGALDDEHLRMLREIGMRSVVIVPMRLAERVIGAMTLVNAESRRAFNSDDVAFAGDLARRAAVAIEHARLASAARPTGAAT